MRRLTLIGLSLLLLAPSPLPAVGAKTPWPVVGICLQPADPHQGIVLRSLRVEITLVEGEENTWAWVKARFSLVNPSRTTPVQMTVGLPTWSTGDRFFRPAEVQGLVVTVNDVPVIPAPQPRPGVENETWLAWPMSFDILDRQFVELAYNTALETGPAPRVAFALSSAAIWADQVESAAIVVLPPSPFQREQVLDLQPPTGQYDGQQLSWHWGAVEPGPQDDVAFAYITRRLWARVEAARGAVAQEPSAANHQALGLLYLTLADRPTFFAQAVAELELAVALAPTDVEIRRALARAYQDRGLSTKDVAYLELALRHWEALRALVPGEESVAMDMRRCHAAAARLLADQRVYPQALHHLEAALALPAAHLSGGEISDAALIQQRDQTRRQWATHLFATGQDVAATKVLRLMGDPYEADYQAYAVPVTRLHGQVSTHIGSDGGTRQITLTWTPFATEVFTRTLKQALQAQVPAAQVQELPASQGLEIILPFAGPAELHQRLTLLAQGLPAHAAWASVRALLVPGEIAYVEYETFLGREVRYRETLPLQAPASDLLRRKQMLDALIAELNAQAGSVPEDPLNLRLTALRSYRAATEQLLRTRLVSRVTLTSLPGHPQTELDAGLGEDQVLEAGAQEWYLWPAALVCGGVMSLILLLGTIGRRFLPGWVKTRASIFRP